LDLWPWAATERFAPACAQYGRPQDQVFPSGQHYKGGNYGSDVNFPVPYAERVNPQFHGCIDRNA